MGKFLTKLEDRRKASAQMVPPFWDPYHAIHLELYRELLECKKLISGGRTKTVLDFGCGSRRYESEFSSPDFQYLGADLPGSKFADIVIENGELAGMEDGVVDVVISNQVLEHVDSPSDYLAEARRVLRSDGLLLLSTHGYWTYHPGPADYWRWTGQGLRKVLSDNGFSVQRFVGLVGPVGAGIQLIQNFIHPKIPRRLRPLVFSVMQRAVLTVKNWGDLGNDAIDFFAVCSLGSAEKPGSSDQMSFLLQ